MTTGTKTLIEYVARALKDARPDINPEAINLAKDEILPRLTVVFNALSDEQLVHLFAEQIAICDKAHRYNNSDRKMRSEVESAVNIIIKKFRKVS